MSISLRQVVLAAAAAAAVLPAAARADRALVVGINKYPGLKGANLAGCVGDANSMAGLLRSFGFQVTALMDEQATRQGILDGLAAMKTQVKPTERFVFFFAGHGTDNTSDDKAALLPSDAKHDSADNDLRRMELYRALRAVPGRSRAAVLDSCYSGGMLYTGEKSITATRRFRYYARDIGGGAKSLRASNDEADIIGGPEICYYTAARDNEQAAEDDFQGSRHGVFTFYIVKLLTPVARGTQKPAWGEVHKQVTGEVADYLKDVQHPTLSQGYAEVQLFEPKKRDNAPVTPVNPPVKPPVTPTPPKKPENSTLYAEFNGDNVDRTKLQLTLVPNQNQLKIGDVIRFEARVGAPGYLVIMEKGTSGAFQFLYPSAEEAPVTAERARMQAPGVVPIPDPKVDQGFRCEDEGAEYVKAFLFPTPQDAQAFIAKMDGFIKASKAMGKESTRASMRDLGRVKMPKLVVYTADITFEVVPKKP